MNLFNTLFGGNQVPEPSSIPGPEQAQSGIGTGPTAE
jgi:hypothetical protein